MSSPMKCRDCAHWRIALGRSDANWGTCTLLIDNGNTHPLIHILADLVASDRLQTRDVFFCAAFEARTKPITATDPTTRKEVNLQ